MLRLRNRQTFVAHKIVVLAGRIEDTSLLQRRLHEGLRSGVPILLLFAPEFKEREREKEASKKRERDQFKGNPADRNAEPGGDPDVPGVDEEGGHEDSMPTPLSHAQTTLLGRQAMTMKEVLKDLQLRHQVEFECMRKTE